MYDLRWVAEKLDDLEMMAISTSLTEDDVEVLQGTFQRIMAAMYTYTPSRELARRIKEVADRIHRAMPHGASAQPLDMNIAVMFI